MTAVAIINDHDRTRARLIAASRRGAVITHHRLSAVELEAARAEAQALYPDAVVYVPRLGEVAP